MKFLVDMNLSPLWVEALAESDIASVHWSTVGDHGAPDSEIMAYALTHEMFVLTHDLDFSAILAATFQCRPSVVQIRAMNVSPNVIGPQVVAAIRQSEAELLEGALVTVEPARLRLRLLPFKK